MLKMMKTCKHIEQSMKTNETHLENNDKSLKHNEQHLQNNEKSMETIFKIKKHTEQ